MNLYELGLALKEARIRRSLKQSELANRTGVSLSTISGLERGSLPEIGTVKLLQLFAAVELELQPRAVGQRRTLDDISAENAQTSYVRGTVSVTSQKNTRKLSGASQRVRHAVKRDEDK